MNSILNSVKEQLGLKFVDEFDQDILIHINAAISTLTQIGVGPKEGFIVKDANDTYFDFLGEDHPAIPQVRLYLFYQTRLGFDTPQSAAAADILKAKSEEYEWRLRIMCDDSKYEKDPGGDANDQQ